jgi:hypothetical protein
MPKLVEKQLDPMSKLEPIVGQTMRFEHVLADPAPEFLNRVQPSRIGWQPDGLSAEEASEVGLTRADVEIDTINLITPCESFEITSLARSDLEQLRFNAAALSDADMQRLSRVMANDYADNLFWKSMKKHAKAMGIPLKPPDPQPTTPTDLT